MCSAYNIFLFCNHILPVIASVTNEGSKHSLGRATNTGVIIEGVESGVNSSEQTLQSLTQPMLEEIFQYHRGESFVFESEERYKNEPKIFFWQKSLFSLCNWVHAVAGCYFLP